MDGLECTEKSPHVKPSYHLGLGPNLLKLPPPPTPETKSQSNDNIDELGSDSENDKNIDGGDDALQNEIDSDRDKKQETSSEEDDNSFVSSYTTNISFLTHI